MADVYSTFQKHEKDRSLTIAPITQSNMQGDIHYVTIVVVQEPVGSRNVTKSQSISLNLEEVLALRDSLLKTYPLTKE